MVQHTSLDMQAPVHCPAGGWPEQQVPTVGLPRHSLPSGAHPAATGMLSGWSGRAARSSAAVP